MRIIAFCLFRLSTPKNVKMKTIHVYANLPNRAPKKISVANVTGKTLRRAIKKEIANLKDTPLHKITFEGFKMGSLDEDFFSSHSTVNNSLKIVVNNQTINVLRSKTFTAEGKLFELTQSLGINPTIYVRQCYRKIWNTFLSYEKKRLQLQINFPSYIAHAYLTGSPGIGKTTFLPFLIDTLLKEKRKVMFGSKDMDGFILWTSRQDFEIVEESKIGDYLRNEDIFFLMDSRDIYNTLGPCIICSSPRSDIARQFCKTALTLYMPIWEWNEVQELHSQVYNSLISKERLSARFFTLGGIPRYLFDNLQLPAAKILDEAINNCDISHLKRLFESKGTTGDEISHRLVHLHSFESNQPPFGEKQLQYASDYATTLIARNYQKDRHDAVVLWLNETSPTGIAGGLRRNLFENIGHLQLMKGGNSSCRNLENNDVVDLIFGPMNLNIVIGDTVSTDQTSFTDGMYYKPMSKIFECIDSWAIINGELWGFQFSISSSLKISSALYWYFQYWNLKHYVIVVYDADNFKNYKKSDITISKKLPFSNYKIPPNGFEVKQYVLLLDCEMTNSSDLMQIQLAAFKSFVGDSSSEDVNGEYQAILDCMSDQ